MPGSVIVSGARTPIGRLMGALSTVSAVDLGAHAISAALAAARLDPAAVEAVVLGHVVQAGAGPNPARQAAIRAGVPFSVPASTVNKLCLSGLHAIALADLMIASGRHEVVVAGGMESMSGAPHLLRGARTGWKYGATAVEDALDRDALVCAFDGVSMGAATERYQQPYALTRAEQDEYSALSHQRAARARESGALSEEIAPFTVTERRGETVVDTDEGVRPDSTAGSLGRLKPAFSGGGTITAGNSSQLSDGAAAVVVMSAERARREGLTPLAEIGAYGTVAGPDPSLLVQPAGAVLDALSRDGRLKTADLDLFEINEAFAGVALASVRELEIPSEKVNVNGGAIALGHPVGMTGARLVLTLAAELRRRGGGTGAAALCGGGGQGDALLLHVPAQA
ncbi:MULTISPECIES: acetyl-CoA C-acyltransferase [Streptomyces]|uniref:Probable acetyl-CoA acetyltransferase n=1 Tax=Streptomyces caniscabiei TaxID=2746961 RepID=A0ABU4MW10_9ACTN|nr:MULTISPECIES: acetyl-CoA C-acyltransferase [Streptomyces]MBE4733386.1 acetyl-CoA C-acyltransferase [Streptomyces caniscabiei]MBE4754564.1 acetyl-CoA C-acyltransferase [Streptomyces caniscabiei]MBE4768615.1 acetyl-CoA C-acyltransferase [Streptomyces caniscabiei]MBE4781881.1 acetyl-CoA C-acyltransferase [Streptomyces caniscabiei]MBE4793171.1 acetyl-CoA C-acyltransferase [Streptomyces caniscabiei]